MKIIFWKVIQNCFIINLVQVWQINNKMIIIKKFKLIMLTILVINKTTTTKNLLKCIQAFRNIQIEQII
jgi:hypothetical protein